MNQMFDPFNLVLLAIALVIFWRLRSVLGSRTGNEQPPLDPYAASRTEKTVPAEPANGNVIRLPKDSGDGEMIQAKDAEPAAPIWTGYAAPGSQVSRNIEKLALADQAFTPRTFLDGAKRAYEMVIDAFAKGDRATLKEILSRELYDGFSRAIDQRESAGHKSESRFVGIGKADFESVELAGKRASITVKFTSEQISATLAGDGSVLEGDPKQIRETIDVWTFERDVSSRDPNWKLVATEEPA